jgi:putative addiction module component (TIGR02574 family)
MVIPELLTAAGALDEDEQRVLAEALAELSDDESINVSKDQQRLIRSRHEEMKADPTLGLTLDQARARLRELLA